MPGKRTQAGCLCYCGDGPDARKKNTGRMPVLLRGRARCPEEEHRQDAVALEDSDRDAQETEKKKRGKKKK
jgi:hypothetical protein